MLKIPKKVYYFEEGYLFDLNDKETIWDGIIVGGYPVASELVNGIWTENYGTLICDNIEDIKEFGRRLISDYVDNSYFYFIEADVKEYGEFLDEDDWKEILDNSADLGLVKDITYNFVDEFENEIMDKIPDVTYSIVKQDGKIIEKNIFKLTKEETMRKVNQIHNEHFFTENLEKYKEGLASARDDAPTEKYITVEDIGNKYSKELANLMFNCEFSWRWFEDKGNLAAMKELIKDVVVQDMEETHIKEYKNYLTQDKIFEAIDKIKISDQNLNLVDECKMAYKNNDLKLASRLWNELYDNHSINYLKTDKERKQVTEELFNIMELFTDNEVYDITDYAKQHYSDINKNIPKVGKILEDGTVRKEYYGQGYIYKNLDNFYSKKGPCYISEYQGELEDSFNKICTKNFKSMIEGEDYETYDSIIKTIKEAFIINNVDSSKISIEEFAEEVFLDVDWQFISTLADEYIEGLDEEYFISESEER